MPKTQNYRRGKRRRMEKFVLGETSGVDRPAQAPATSQIRKRVGPRDGETFQQFFNRIQMDDPLLPREVARLMYDEALSTTEEVEMAKRVVDDMLTDEDWLLLEKRGGPRPGESFEEFFGRMREDNASMTRDRARQMFDGAGGSNDSAEKRGDLVSMATSSEAGHQHGITVYGGEENVGLVISYASGEDGEMHDHQVVMNTDGSYSVTENRGHSHEIDASELQRVLMQAVLNKTDNNQSEIPRGGSNAGSLSNGLSGDATQQQELQMTKTDLQKAQERVGALEAENAELRKVSALSADQRAYYDSLDPTLEADARKRFLDSSADERDGTVAKAAEIRAAANPVVFTSVDGTEFHKNDDPRLIKMAKERDEERREALTLRKAAEDAALEKRAESDLANFPGEVEVRKAILRAVDGIGDENLRKAANEALCAQNARMHSAFVTVGAEGQSASPLAKSADGSGAIDELDRLAKARAAAEGEDYYTAYEKVSEVNPELLAKAIRG